VEERWVDCEAALEREEPRGMEDWSEVVLGVVGVTGLVGLLGDEGPAWPSLVRFLLRKPPRACIKRASKRDSRPDRPGPSNWASARPRMEDRWSGCDDELHGNQAAGQ
jgi:hypothetical protein